MVLSGVCMSPRTSSSEESPASKNSFWVFRFKYIMENRYVAHVFIFLYDFYNIRIFSSSAACFRFGSRHRARCYRCCWPRDFLLYKSGGLVQVSLRWLDKERSVRYVSCSTCVTWYNLASAGRYRRTETLPPPRESNTLITAHHRSNGEPYCS